MLRSVCAEGVDKLPPGKPEQDVEEVEPGLEHQVVVVQLGLELGPDLGLLTVNPVYNRLEAGGRVVR